MTVLRVSLGVVAISAWLVACGGGDEDPVDGGRDPVDARVTDSTTPPIDSNVPDGTTPGRMCGIAGGACDVIAQDCGGASEGCYYARTSENPEPTTLCAPSGTGGDGDACENVDDCQPGFTCGNDGACRHYCCMGMASDCTPGQICIGISGAGEIGVCNAIDNCTLAPQGGCEAGEGCQIVAGDGSTSCFMAGTTPEGGACETIDACQPGFGCYGTSGGAAQCTGFCRIDGDDCTDGHTCTQINGGTGFPAGIGLCLEGA